MKIRWLRYLGAFLLGAIVATAVGEYFRVPAWKRISLPTKGGTQNPTSARLVMAVPSPSPAAEKNAGPDRTLEKFLELYASPRSSSHYRRDLERLKDSLDPQRLPEYARTLFDSPFSPGQDRAVAAIIAAWSEHDPQAAAAFVLAAPDKPGDLRGWAYFGLADGWPEDDAAGLLAFADRVPWMPRKDVIIRQIAINAAERDPALAIAAASELGLDNRDTADLLNRWSDRDATAARQWLQQQPPGPGRDQLFADFVGRLDARNPDEALAWISLLSSAEAQDKALRTLGETWTPRDPAAIKRIIAAQSDLTVRASLQSGYLKGLADADPAALAREISSNPNLPDLENLILKAISAWVPRDRAPALAWVTSLPATPLPNRGGPAGVTLRDQAVTLAAMRWGADDPDAAVDWLASQIPPGSPSRNILLQQLQEISGNDGVENPGTEVPRLALKLTSLQTDPAIRQALESKIAAAWFRRNPTAAEKWLASSDLSEVEKARIRATPPSVRR